MAADVVLFNSQYNMTSFLHSMDSIFKLMPKDQCPPINNLRSIIGGKTCVLYFPIDFNLMRDTIIRVYSDVPYNAIVSNIFYCTKINTISDPKVGPMHVLWNHRWEW